VRLTEKAAEHCVLRPAGFRIIVQKDRRRSPGIAIIAAAAGQCESKDCFRARNSKAVAKPTHKRQLSGPFVKCEATPLARPDPIGRRQPQRLSKVGDRARSKILEAQQCFVGCFADLADCREARGRRHIPGACGKSNVFDRRSSGNSGVGSTRCRSLISPSSARARLAGDPSQPGRGERNFWIQRREAEYRPAKPQVSPETERTEKYRRKSPHKRPVLTGPGHLRFGGTGWWCGQSHANRSSRRK
jgi:hypothetical protein